MTAPLTHTILEAVVASGVSKSSLYLAIKRGDLPARKLGKRTLILASDLAAWLEQLPKLKTG
jgi:excisionase family DNA binding protein